MTWMFCLNFVSAVRVQSWNGDASLLVVLLWVKFPGGSVKELIHSIVSFMRENNCGVLVLVPSRGTLGSTSLPMNVILMCRRIIHKNNIDFLDLITLVWPLDIWWALIFLCGCLKYNQQWMSSFGNKSKNSNLSVGSVSPTLKETSHICVFWLTLPSSVVPSGLSLILM